MATGVTSWSTNAASNNTADANVNWAEGMAPSQVNDSARAEMASVALYRNDNAGSLLTAGGPSAFTVTTNQGFASLAALDGVKLIVRFNVTATTSVTLAVDGLAAKNITIDGGNNVGQGMLRKNAIHTLTYNNSLGVFTVHDGHSLIEPGRIAVSANNFVTPGWLLCDGTGYSRTTYADLFANISTTYGSSDASSFKVPNLVGRMPIGVDSASSVTTGVTIPGATAGAQATTLTTGNIPGISYTPQGTIGGSQSLGTLLVNTGGGNQIGGTGGNSQATTVQGSNFTFTGTAATIGNASPSSFTNIPPALALNFYIKT